MSITTEVDKQASKAIENKERAGLVQGTGQLFFDDIQKCQGCDLCRLEINLKKHKTVGAGNLDVDILLVGIGTSWYRKDENTNYGGTPFGLFAEEIGEEKSNIVGTTRPLYKLIENLGLTRFYITNLMKCSTFNDEDPNYDQRDACASWLRKEIETLKPKLILCFGAIFKKNLALNYGDTETIDDIDYMLLYHPGYIMRSGKTHLYEEAAEKIKKNAKERRIRLC